MHSAFASGYCDWPTLQSRIGEWPLYHYAVHFWPHHVIYSGDALDEKTWLLLQLFFKTRESGIGGSYAAWVVTLTPSIKLKDMLDTQPLYFAASFGIESLIRKILDTDPNLDIEAPGGRYGSSPLQVASFRNRTAAVKLLLEANANPMSQNRGGQSCLFWAVLRKHTEISNLLQSHGATLTQEDKKRLGRMQANTKQTGKVSIQHQRESLDTSSPAFTPWSWKLKALITRRAKLDGLHSETEG